MAFHHVYPTKGVPHRWARVTAETQPDSRGARLVQYALLHVPTGTTVMEGDKQYFVCEVQMSSRPILTPAKPAGRRDTMAEPRTRATSAVNMAWACAGPRLYAVRVPDQDRNSPCQHRQRWCAFGIPEPSPPHTCLGALAQRPTASPQMCAGSGACADGRLSAQACAVKSFVES